MADDTSYTPEELAALEATATRGYWVEGEHAEECDLVCARCCQVGGAEKACAETAFSQGCTGTQCSCPARFDRETCLRLIHQLRQQTARAEAAEQERGIAQMHDDSVSASLSQCLRERDAARTALAEMTTEREEIHRQVERAGIAHGFTIGNHVSRELPLPQRVYLLIRKAMDSQFETVAQLAEARTALAAAEVERARIRAALERYGRHEQFPGSRADQSCKINPGGPIMAAFGRPNPHPCTCGYTEALGAASPHADLAAVRQLVKTIYAMEYQYDPEMEEALAALPSWCREQP